MDKDLNFDAQNLRTGAPVNMKSMVAFLFNQMDMLNQGLIDANKACAQAKLAGQITRAFEYELKKTVVQIKLHEINSNIEPKLQELESKKVD